LSQIIGTTHRIHRLKFRVDYSGKSLAAGKNDVVFVYADVTDANGTVIPEANPMIEFSVQGDGEIIGPSSVKAEAGIATILLKAGTKPLPIKVVVKAADLAGNELLLRSD
jgi:beta-galactosidase